ncbi:MAG: CPBP family intramembrane metalloprotease, partial [Verrucomicrobiae bacterium]|nr:CPBP family intramembrane metalloprotease [Verrucomicrobiae bacterium]
MRLLTLFWNSRERRLRAGWRLLVFGALLLLSSIPAGIIMSLDVGTRSSRLAIAHSLWTVLLFGAALLHQARWVDWRPFREYGFRHDPKWGRQLLFGLALGAALMGLIFGVEMAAGWVRLKPTEARTSPGFHSSDLLFQMMLFISVAIGEELTHRGCLLRNLAEGFNPGIRPSRGAALAAGLVGAVAFGFLHADNESASLLTSLNIAVAGIFLGLCLLWTGSLAIPIGVHFSWNFFQGPVFGFRVSGEDAGQPLLDIVQGGPSVMTGGAFGPEGGLLSTLATALGIGAVALWVRWR